MQNSSPFSSIQNEGNSFAESKKFSLESQLALFVSAVLSMSIFFPQTRGICRIIWSFLSINLLVQNPKLHFLHMGTGTTTSKGTMEIINYVFSQNLVAEWPKVGPVWLSSFQQSQRRGWSGLNWNEFKGRLTVLPLEMRGWLCLKSFLLFMYERITKLYLSFWTTISSWDI